MTSQIFEILNIVKLCINKVVGLCWHVSVWCGLMKHSSLAESDCQAEEFECVQHQLQIALCIGHQCTVISKVEFLEEILKALFPGSEATNVKERAVQKIVNADSMLQILDIEGQRAGQEKLRVS